MNVLEEENMEKKEKLEKEKENTKKKIEPEINLAKKKIVNIKKSIEDFNKTLQDQKQIQLERERERGRDNGRNPEHADTPE